MNKKKSVLLIEDDKYTREHLECAINSHDKLIVTKSCSNLNDGLHALHGDPPDIVVTDLGLPDGSGIDIIRAARKQDQTIEIMVISVFGDERNVISAIESGASGYLLKDGDSEYIGDAIIQVINGQSPISPAIARHLLKRYRTKSENDIPSDIGMSDPKLTNRETEVLQCMAKGYTFVEAAQILDLSHHTVTTHVKKIYRKLEVNSRSEAVYEALQLGLVDIRS